MAALNSQSSPFGHLMREQHIQSLGRSQRKKDGAPGCQAKGILPSREGTSQVKEAACEHDRRSVEPAPWMGADAPCKAEFPGCELASRRREPAREEAAESPPGWRGRRARRRSPEQISRWVQEGEDVGPEGLQVLAGISQLHVTSQAEPRGFAGDPGKTYMVRTTQAKRLLVATEETSCLCLHLCGPARTCSVHLRDLHGQDLLWLRRPFGAGASCLGCFQTEVQVFTGDRLLGSIRRRWGVLAHLWDVRDPHGVATMRIRGSCTASRCCSNQEFQVTSRTGSPVAVIWKRWPGFNEDRNMDHEFFGVDISVKVGAEDAALLLAAAFLLNFIFFEMS